MENYTFDDPDDSGEQGIDADSIDSSEEAFMKGYAEDEEVEECAECGSAINPEKKVVRERDEEKFSFCSKLCADEFEENL